MGASLRVMDERICLPCTPVSEQLTPRPRALGLENCASVLPPELWKQVWDGLDKGFFPTGHPEINMGGACKCGKLKFKVEGTLAASFQCHCHMCRRYWSQATPTPTLWVQPANCLSVTSGEEY